MARDNLWPVCFGNLPGTMALGDVPYRTTQRRIGGTRRRPFPYKGNIDLDPEFTSIRLAMLDQARLGQAALAETGKDTFVRRFQEIPRYAG